MKNVLVTGASGGMGVAICESLVAKGYKVYGIDYRVGDKINGVEFFECDVTDTSSIEAVYEKIKAQNIKDASAMLIAEFGGELPSDMDELLRFPGVGRKIANLLIGDVFGGPAIVCDTHCIRICARLGMYPESEKNPEKIERILSDLMDRKDGSDFCHRIVIFGREVCSARNPACHRCPLASLCEHNGKKK